MKAKGEPTFHKKQYLRLPVKRMLPQLDLDAELKRHNVGIAEFIILAGLIKGNVAERQRVMEAIEPRHFDADLFPQYLFASAVHLLQIHPDHRFSTDWMISVAKKYLPEIWNIKPTRRRLRGELFSCAQILDLSPTPEQVTRAIDLRREVAAWKGLI